jgi:hypothetical protein
VKWPPAWTQLVEMSVDKNSAARLATIEPECAKLKNLPLFEAVARKRLVETLVDCGH